MYDASFTGWWQWAVDTLLQLANQKLSSATGKPVTPAQTLSYVQNKLATSICTTAQKYCLGPELQQYSNFTSCYTYLTKATRFGEAHELGTSIPGPVPISCAIWRARSPSHIPYRGSVPRQTCANSGSQAGTPCSAAWCTRTWCRCVRRCTARTSGPAAGDTASIVRITWARWGRVTSVTIRLRTGMGV